MRTLPSLGLVDEETTALVRLGVRNRFQVRREHAGKGSRPLKLALAFEEHMLNNLLPYLLRVKENARIMTSLMMSWILSRWVS